MSELLSQSTNQKTKTIFLGLDGLEWNILHPLIEAGSLPTFANLIAEGASGDLATLNPTLSPILWNSIATGKRADAHGILGFTEVDHQSGKVRPVSSISRQCKAIWNILMQSGFNCHVINWFASHPAEPLNGSCVSDLFPEGATTAGEIWPLPKGTVHPVELRKSLAALRISGDELPPDLIRLLVPDAHQVDQKKDQKLQLIARELAKAYSIHSATSWLLENRTWDFCAAYWRTPDLLKHHFMPYHPPALDGVDLAAFEMYQNVVSGIYRLFDVILRKYVELLPSDANLIVVSDHGFKTGSQRPKFHENPFTNPEAWHHSQGVFIAKGPAIKAGSKVFGARLVDVAPTILTLNRVAPAQDMNGRVLTEIFETPPKLSPIESWESIKGECGTHPPGTQYDTGDAQALLDQFVALGYIDPIDSDAEVAAHRTTSDNNLNLAREWIDQNRPGMALPLLEELHSEQPENGAIAQLLVHAQRNLGLITEAEITLDTLSQNIEEGPMIMILRAQVSLDRKDLDTGLKQLKEIERKYPESLDAQGLIGRVYNRLGQFDVAERCFKHIIKKDHHAALAYQGLAEAQLKLRRPMDALESALAAIERRPDLTLAHYFLALAAERMGMRKHAIEALRVCLSYGPRYRAAHKIISALYRDNGEFENAKKHEESLALLNAELGKEKKRLQALRRQILKRSEKRRLHLKDQQNTSEKRIPPPHSNYPAESKVENQQFLIVSGVPRSGTSLMMQLLKAGGKPLLVDDVRKADANNTKGFFEYEPIKRLHTNPSVIEKGKDKATKVVSMLLRHLPRRHSYKIIYMKRDPSEVSDSQACMIEKMHQNGPQPESDKLAQLLSRHVDTTLQYLTLAENVDFITIEHRVLLENPEGQIDRLLEFLNEPTPMDRKAMSQVIDLNLWRSRNPRSSATDSE